ncbi:MAG: MGMT family protein [Pseudomonadales bacterium]|jgi:methylated-DNA-protein-cysteine methyltransferase-like protein
MISTELNEKQNDPLSKQPSAEVKVKRESIWQVVHMIPSGKVATYGQVAALAGLPKAARFAGTSLKGLPKATRIPWHRVINAQGRISLPPSSASYQEQHQRLIQEGVLIRNGRIALKDYQWEP